MLQNQLQNDMKQAMISKRAIARDILRFVLSQIKNKEIDTQKQLTDDQIIKIIQKEVKQINETMDSLRASNTDWLDDEQEKIDILSAYLPEMLSEDELQKIVIEKVAALALDDPKKNRGPLIGSIMHDYGSSVDGNLLNNIINTL